MAEIPALRSLSHALGAEVQGFDFARPPDASTQRFLREALDATSLLLFRDASLSAERQVALLETFGPALLENESGRPYQFVSNRHAEGILGDERFAFHSDHAFMPDPIEVISLYALEVPATGTRTRFVSGLQAARSLPDWLEKQVGARRGRHVIDPAAESGDIAIHGPERGNDLPHAYHPVLWPHPRTGERILYVSEQQTDSIETLDREEGRTLIEKLFEHLYQPDFEYAHEWQPGDLLIWDNLALQHAREAISPGTSRTLRRVAIGGTPVYEFFRRIEKWGLD